ncbi:MAG: universal stress protein [Candidatus Thorarchaeota archaeon]
MYKKILLGMDKSDDAFHAAKRAIEFQKRDNCKVVAFHSVLHHLSEMNPNPFSPTGVSVGISYTIHNDYIKRGEEILRDLDELFKEANAKVETRLIFDIPPEDYIKKMVEEEDFDLIILGCKGHHSKLSRIFLGTVPIKVINNVSIDVLIVR